MGHHHELTPLLATAYLARNSIEAAKQMEPRAAFVICASLIALPCGAAANGLDRRSISVFANGPTTARDRGREISFTISTQFYVTGNRVFVIGPEGNEGAATVVGKQGCYEGLGNSLGKERVCTLVERRGNGLHVQVESTTVNEGCRTLEPGDRFRMEEALRFAFDIEPVREDEKGDETAGCRVTRVSGETSWQGRFREGERSYRGELMKPEKLSCFALDSRPGNLDAIGKSVRDATKTLHRRSQEAKC